MYPVLSSSNVELGCWSHSSYEDIPLGAVFCFDKPEISPEFWIKMPKHTDGRECVCVGTHLWFSGGHGYAYYWRYP